MKTTAPYGSWESQITAEFVAGQDRGLTPSLQADGDELYFLEARPDEGGRQALMRLGADGKVTDALPKEYNVRTRYLEYGGLSFLVHKGTVYFVSFAGQQVYRARPGESPAALTNEEGSRFADLVLDERRNRLIALREAAAKPESRNTICAIDLTGGAVTDLVSGRDFFLAPRVSPGGDKLLWISWNHPNMAWNGTELFVAAIERDGSVGAPEKIAGDANHGVCQPEWVKDDEIVFVAELGKWFNLHRYRKGRVENVYPAEAEFAYPDWTPGQKQHASSGGAHCASFLQKGAARFLLIAGESAKVLAPEFASVSGVVPSRGGFYALATFPASPPAIVRIGLDGECREVYRSYELKLSADEISSPLPLEFPTEDGGIGYAWYYAPKSAKFAGPANEKPPLVVMCHGGPTAMSTGDFRKGVQFWTNRGYAVADVNYGGSTGYGRDYRERLRGR